jgi:hypothetical protein
MEVTLYQSYIMPEKHMYRARRAHVSTVYLILLASGFRLLKYLLLATCYFSCGCSHQLSGAEEGTVRHVDKANGR